MNKNYKKISDDLILTPQNKFLYNDGIEQFSESEIERLNKKEIEDNKKALEDILKLGYIRFPVFFKNPTTEELVESSYYLPPAFEPSCKEGFVERHKMNFNIYIPSYGRAGTAYTAKMLDDFNVSNYYLAIDATQFEEYSKYYDTKHIIIRDTSFRGVDKLDMLTSKKSPNTYHGTAGLYNSLLYFSRSLGESHYWTIDDDMIGLAMKAYKGDSDFTGEMKYNKDDFFRCSNLLEKYGFSFTKFMKGLEDLMLKARNPGFLGLEKFGLVFNLPIKWRLGTRLYSFYLTNNKNQINHFGQHNNDVITSLGMSRAGYVNMLFEGVYYNSGPTQVGGGLTETYKKFGTLDKGKILVTAMPDCSKISYKYNRIHHTANYNKYNTQRLVGAPIKKDK